MVIFSQYFGPLDLFSLFQKKVEKSEKRVDIHKRKHIILYIAVDDNNNNLERT